MEFTYPFDRVEEYINLLSAQSADEELNYAGIILYYDDISEEQPKAGFCFYELDNAYRVNLLLPSFPYRPSDLSQSNEDEFKFEEFTCPATIHSSGRSGRPSWDFVFFSKALAPIQYWQMTQTLSLKKVLN